jgi:hypothetical protein
VSTRSVLPYPGTGPCASCDLQAANRLRAAIVERVFLQEIVAAGVELAFDALERDEETDRE